MNQGVSAVHNHNSGMPLGYAVQLVMKGWNAWLWAAGRGITQTVLHYYMFYNNCPVKFVLIGIHGERYVLH